MKRSRLGQPDWASEEESKLAKQWLDSDTALSITDFIWKHASERLKKEYVRQEKAYQKMTFGRKTLSDGEIIIYN